jgi:hypothetical protein
MKKFEGGLLGGISTETTGKPKPRKRRTFAVRLAELEEIVGNLCCRYQEMSEVADINTQRLHQGLTLALQRMSMLERAEDNDIFH